VLAELQGIKTITNHLGVELVTERIAPVRREYTCPPPAQLAAHASPDELEPVVTLWCVVSGTPGGYDVVFDEVTGRFGISVVREDGERTTVIGWYPTLLDAFRGM
jgi:hypothetical protein